MRKILFFVALLLVTQACKKKEQLLGSTTYDKNLLLHSDNIDTFFIKTYTFAQDTVESTNPLNVLLGKVNHSKLGEYSTGFYTQVRLSGINPNFGDVSKIEVDSFILSLEYRGGYGYAGQHTVEVYELSEAMNKDSIYTTNQDLTTNMDNWVLGTGLLTIDPKTETIIGGDTLAAQLRIPLDPIRAKKIIEDAHNDTYKSMFANNNEFSENYLKGFYVKISDGEHPAQGGGIIGYFDIADADSRISIYYKEDGVAKPPFSLVFNNECVRYNRFTYSNSGTQLDALIGDSTLGQDEFYALAGKYKGQIEFPTIKSLPENIVVYSAQIQLPIQYLATSQFAYPQQISLIQNEGTPTEFIATYDPLIKGYRANIQLFVQNYLQGTIKNPSLVISPRLFVSGAEFLIFNGQQTDKKIKPKLILSYTKF